MISFELSRLNSTICELISPHIANWIMLRVVSIFSIKFQDTDGQKAQYDKFLEKARGDMQNQRPCDALIKMGRHRDSVLRNLPY